MFADRVKRPYQSSVDQGGSIPVCPQMFICSSSSYKRSKNFPGSVVFGSTFHTIEEAQDALCKDGEKYGITFWKSDGYVSKKSTKGGCVYFCCSKKRDPKNPCPVRFVLKHDNSYRECAFDSSSSTVEHVGHDYLTPRNLVIADDDLRTPVGCENAEEIRKKQTIKLPPELLSQGLRGTHPTLEERYRLQNVELNENVFTLITCKRSRVYHDIIPFAGGAKEFESHLGVEDASYLKWWIDGLRRDSHTEYMTVVGGISPVELQISMTYVQQASGVLDHGNRDSVANARYAIFHGTKGETLLAIDGHALRAYRLHCMCMLTNIGSTMPVAPVLLQAWTQVPRKPREESVRRLAMRTTLDFIYANITYFRLQTPDSGGIFDVTHPGFALYDFFPDFLKLFYINDSDLDEHVILSTMSTSRDSDTYYAWMAGFILQHEMHYIMTHNIERIYYLFTPENKHYEGMRTKYPYAYAVAEMMQNNFNGNICIPITMTDKAWGKLGRPPHGLPPHYFLYQLCFEEEMVSFETRRMLAAALKVSMQYRSSIPDPPHPVKGRALPRAVREKLYVYDAAYSRSTTEAKTLGLSPFSNCMSELFPLLCLYRMLRGMDAVRHDDTFSVIYDEDFLDPLFDQDRIGERTGGLNISDPIKFATRIYNLPVACETKRETSGPRVKSKKHLQGVAYFENTIWAWPIKKRALQLEEDDELNGPSIAVLEAMILVRDVRYYLEYHQRVRLNSQRVN